MTLGQLMATHRWTDIRLLYWRELRSAFRERNIVINGILLPVFLYPLLLWLLYTGITFVRGQTEGFVSRVALQGVPQEHVGLKKLLEKDSRVELKAAGIDAAEDIRSGKLDLLANFTRPAGQQGGPEDFRVHITFDGSKDRSKMARDRFSEVLTHYRDQYLERQAASKGISAVQLQQFWTETRNLATSRQMGQFLLGMMLPLFMVIMVAVGCMYPAIDSTAGEREKSTWETSMTIAAPRIHLIVAKYLYVTTMAALAGILNLIAMLLSVKSVLAPILHGEAETFTFRIPLYSLPLIILMTILLASFIAAGMMIFASFARTFREGQALISPFYAAVFMPALFLQSPGIQFNTGLALIPIINVAMVFREAIAGKFRWPLIGITLVVEALCVVLALWLAARILRYEDFLVGNYGGNLILFSKERLFAGRHRERR